MPIVRSKKGYLWKASKEQAARYQKTFKEKHPERVILNRARYRAKKLGLEFNLTPDDIIIPSRCPCFGFALYKGPTKGYHDQSPSLDRIDPNKGYVKGNVQVISGLANLMKNRATPEELKKFASWVLICQ